MSLFDNKSDFVKINEVAPEIKGFENNGEFFYSLSKEERKKYTEMYGNHPLVKFIDWQAFYASSGGNEMKFVKCIDKVKDNDGGDVYILANFSTEDGDFQLAYVVNEDSFYKIPVDTPSPDALDDADFDDM